MLKNYFKIAWRNLLRNKFYAVLNISGLAVGLATGIMLLLWVQHELNYDRFHVDHEHIYKFNAQLLTNGEKETWTEVPGPLAVFAKSISQVQSFVRMQILPDQVIADKSKNKQFDNNTVAFADSGFFSMFNFNLLKGNKTTAFPNINSVVLTETTANRYFGNQNPIGKTIWFYESLFTVTGVLQNFPENSSIRFDALFPMGFLAADFTANGGNGEWKTINEDLGSYVFISYVKLRPEAGVKETEKAFDIAYQKARNITGTTFRLQNLADVHLISADGDTSAYRMIQIFMLVVVLLLAIASINYVNLSTARSLMRSKEVGIRKISGAQRKQLFVQFSIETLVLFSFACAFALALIILLMPLYTSISGKSLSLGLANASVWNILAIAVVGTLIASSVYPALLLSSFKPLVSLKGKMMPGIGIASLRKGLVIFQFAVSVILLVCTMIMNKQMKYVKNKNLGYDKKHVFSVPLTDEVIKHSDAIKTVLKNRQSAWGSAMSDVSDLSNAETSTGDISWPGKPDNSSMLITAASIDNDFIPTMKIKFLEGGNFSGTPADSSSFILNETAVLQMGLKRPFVGQKLELWSRKGTIKGVVKDFHFKSLKNKISPFIFHRFWDGNVLYVRTSADQTQNAIAIVEDQYKKYAGNSPFSYTFLDENFKDQYQTDQRTGTLFTIFTGIAIFISCLGLFGLATYSAQVRIKEIGIRKTLGASVGSIIKLISTGFLKLVIIAIIIAIPIALYLVNQWLQNFEYQTSISWWMFAGAGLLALLIALLTVSFQAIKAALANPVESLRTE